MKTEDAVKMIELCLSTINDHDTLKSIQILITDRHMELITKKPRKYTKKESL